MLNLIFSGKVEDFEEIETNVFPVAARVDFIEPILGDELLNIVSEWIRGLRENRDKKIHLLYCCESIVKGLHSILIILY